MILNDLNSANLFKFFKNVSRPGIIAFRISGESLPETITIIPVMEYVLLHPDKNVFPICLVENYSAAEHVSANPTKLKDVDYGTIAWTGSEYGLPQRILVTEHVNRSAIIVGFLGEPELVNSNIKISDLGPAGKYNGYRDDYRLRYCPNCSQRVLIKDEIESTPGFNVTCICRHCGCKVAISWAMMR